MKGLKNLLFLSITLGMLIYAVPRLHVGEGWTLPSLFAVIWIGFALLIVAAHLHELLGVDEEERAELKRLEHYRIWHRHQLISKRMNESQSGK